MMAFSSSEAKEKKKKDKEKKNHLQKKNVEKGASWAFFSRFCIWDEALLLPSSLHVLSMLTSPPWSLVFHVSSKLCATQA